jgi:L-amino acid N-acyltransferase YncA
MKVRPAEPGDAQAIADVYNQGIAERSATFVTEPRSAEQVRGWMVQRGPFLVAEEEGEVVGWAGLSDYSDVPAYAGVGEFAIYVGRQARGRGVGRALLEALCLTAERDGRHKVIGKLFPENQGSRALCAACGFAEVGVHRRHGRLEGRWRDVLVVERLLGPPPEEEP